jgi:peptidoglycan-associated lipoprotein
MKIHELARGHFTAAIKIVFGAVALFYLAGCSTAKPVEPQAAAQSQNQTPADKQGVGNASISQSSSLDQLQKGAAVGTPASSPLKDIYFDFDRYDLGESARGTLKANAEWLKQNPSATVQIEGHCDERGTAEYNLALGAKRAQAAKDYLTTLGVDAQRLSTISYGQELPVCTEHTEECWQQNRHDRFVPKSLPTS